MQTRATILLAEDDNSLAFMLKDSLEEEGYRVVHCADGQSAIDAFQKDKFDLCILDIMMPIKDGYSVANKIRQKSDVIPILFLTTKNLEDDKLKGYDIGADDFISKPFSLKELLRKIEVFLKRTKKKHSENFEDHRIGSIVYSPVNLVIVTPTTKFELTSKESELLNFLCNNKNQVVTREEALLNVWGKDDYFLGRSMDVFIARLRKYLKEDESVKIETIHGVGYRFIVPE